MDQKAKRLPMQTHVLSRLARVISSFCYVARAATLEGEPLFAAKTIMALITPGGFGYIRRLRRDTEGEAGLTQGGSEFQKIDQKLIARTYVDYDHYLAHQASKLDIITGSRGWFKNRLIYAWRIRFFKHLKELRTLLPEDARILCVGARQGTEVEVLRELGFRHAIGIDINPGPGNPFVRKGDFMRLNLADESQDAIYSNAVDHALDLDEFFREQARVVKKGGYGVFDFAEFNGEYVPGSFEVIAWETTDTPVAVMSRYFPTKIADRREGGWRTVVARR